MTAYRRVLLKLSGEVFGGGRVGVDPDVVNGIAREVASVVRSGVQVAVVVGGGNFFRGAELQQRGMDRSRADYMGMLGTVMNCLALQDFLEKQGVETRVQTAIAMGQVAAQRALEVGAQVILMGKQGVDGVYDSDPNTNPDAVKFDSLSYDEFLTRGLKVADATAISLCRDNDIDMIVFNLSEEGNIARVVAGEKIGTTVARDV